MKNQKATNEKAAKEKITKDMMIGELIEKHHDAAWLLINAGVHCVGCGAAHMETIEDGLKAHGKSDEEINKLIEEMNKPAMKKK